MAGPVSFTKEGSEEWAQTLLGYTVLAFAPPCLMLVIMATKFRGLWSATAMDQAQVADIWRRERGWLPA